jgi:excisionase family DNA binding protein
MPDNKAFYRVQTVAERFEVTYRTVCDWIRSGKLEAVVLGSGRIRISEEAIQKSLQPLTPKLKIRHAAQERTAGGSFKKAAKRTK